MKARLTLIFAALVVLLGAMIWVVQDRHNEVSPALAATAPVIVASDTPQVANAPASAVPAPALTIAAAPAPAPAPDTNTPPMVTIDPDGSVKYVARDGDTLSQLAVALLGSDSKANRDAVIAANPSLQNNADRVLAWQTYSISGAAARAPSAASAPQAAQPAPAIATSVADDAAEKSVPAATGPKLKYVAQPGDTVGVLAANLLGGNTAGNRETIISANPSLRDNPDLLVAGQTYTIPAPDGLATDAKAHSAAVATSQPDADDAARASVGRALRYTAQPDDTVSKLAVVLLGSDTPSNRELIIKSNPSLKENPDHLVAGKTYWIDAPTADAAQ